MHVKSCRRTCTYKRRSVIFIKTIIRHSSSNHLAEEPAYYQINLYQIAIEINDIQKCLLDYEGFGLIKSRWGAFGHWGSPLHYTPTLHVHTALLYIQVRQRKND